MNGEEKMDILAGLPKVLIVSESKTTREKYKTYLKAAFGECCTYTESAYGQEAITLCMKDKPDCVILDSVLADIHSIEFLERTKEIENFPEVQIVLLIGENTSIKIGELKPLGAQNYLLKKLVTQNRLCSIVVKAVKASRDLNAQKEEQKAYQAA